MESFARAIALRPSYAEAWNNQGDMLRKLGKLKDARASYEKALDFRQGYHKALFGMGATLYELGQLDEAKSYLLKAWEVRTHLPDKGREAKMLLSTLGCEIEKYE